MNLLSKKWIIKGNAKLNYANNKINISNNSDKHSIIVCPKIFKNSTEKITLFFKGTLIKGNAPIINGIGNFAKNKKRL